MYGYESRKIHNMLSFGIAYILHTSAGSRTRAGRLLVCEGGRARHIFLQGQKLDRAVRDTVYILRGNHFRGRRMVLRQVRRGQRTVPRENKFLFYTVPLTFRTDSYGNSLPAENELTVNSAFYGTYYSGGFAYSYVRYNGNFYYTSGANDGYPLNEIPSQNVDGPPPSAPDGSPSTEKIIIAVVIACVAVGALVGVYITSRRARYFRPDK